MTEIEPDPCVGCIKNGHLCYGCSDKESWEEKYLYDEQGNLKTTGIKKGSTKMSEKIPCKIVLTKTNGDFKKCYCSVHNQYLLYVYTIKGNCGMRCQVGEDNQSYLDFDTPVTSIS